MSENDQIILLNSIQNLVTFKSENVCESNFEAILNYERYVKKSRKF